MAQEERSGMPKSVIHGLDVVNAHAAGKVTDLTIRQCEQQLTASQHREEETQTGSSSSKLELRRWKTSQGSRSGGSRKCLEREERAQRDKGNFHKNSPHNESTRGRRKTARRAGNCSTGEGSNNAAWKGSRMRKL